MRMEASRDTVAGNTIGFSVEKWAGETPAAAALSDAAGKLTYAELAHRIEQVCVWLRSLGLSPGDRILVVAENSVSLALLILAADRAGITAVLENARRAGAEIGAIREHCDARLTIFVFSNSSDARAHAERDAVSALVVEPLGEVAVRHERQEQAATAARGEGERPAVIIYTTGTTGTPKGVMLPPRVFEFISSQMRALRYVTPQDIVYGVLPITHVMGLASVLSGALVSGAHLHLVPRFSAADCVDFVRERGVTMLQGAPAMFAKIIDHCRAKGIARLQGVRFIGSGGAPIDPVVKHEAEQLFGVPLHNGYGLTEAASTCWTRFEDDNGDDTVGRPLPQVEIRVERKTPADDVGELWVRGPHVMTGYFRDPMRTVEVLTPDGWFNTQDLARIGGDGRVYIVGRTKDIIIRSGFNVYPLEVELTLCKHPDVLHCAVLGRKVKGNEEIVAYVELAQGAAATPGDLSAFLAERLSPYKRPNEIVLMDALPVAANGKVLKSALSAAAAV